jgi:hypothetical protein
MLNGSTEARKSEHYAGRHRRPLLPRQAILACPAAGIAVVLPAKRPLTQRFKAFDKADFIYDQQENEYRCRGGQSKI